MTRNADLLRRIADHIETHPDTYDQREWVSGHCHCIGGWAIVLGSGQPYRDAITGRDRRNAATQALGLTQTEADRLFSPSLMLADDTWYPTLTWPQAVAAMLRQLADGADVFDLTRC